MPLLLLDVAYDDDVFKKTEQIEGTEGITGNISPVFLSKDETKKRSRI